MIGGAILACIAGVYLAAALRLPLGVAANAGPGLFPLITGSLLAVASLVIVATSVRRRPRDVHTGNGVTPPEVGDGGAQGTVPTAATPPVPIRGQHVRLLALGVVCIGYMVLLPYFGLAVIAAGTAYFVMLIGQAKRKVLALGVAVVLGLAAQYLFITVLHVPLPATPIGV